MSILSPRIRAAASSSPIDDTSAHPSEFARSAAVVSSGPPPAK
jgi:hypothetical protein